MEHILLGMAATVIIMSPVDLIDHAIYESRLSLCTHPMPDEMFPWVRCIPGRCWWCDSMQQWIRDEPRESSRGGPYRSERTWNRS